MEVAEKHLPKEPKVKNVGRPHVNSCDVLDGIGHILWTGCQWKSIEKEWFKVSSSVLHERFQTWQEQGLFEKLFKKMVKSYASARQIGWRWQSVDSMMSPTPLGGSQTGKNPTDRGKLGSKVHLLVDERGAPLAIFMTGANEHDKWSADDLIVHIVAKRPNSEQHFVPTRATIMKMSINLSNHKTILSTSSIGAGAMNQKKIVQFLAKRTFQPDVGWLKEHLAGSPNVAVLLPAGAKAAELAAFVHMACAQILLNIILG